MQQKFEDKYPAGVRLRDWEDSAALRKDIFENAKQTLIKQFPQSYGGVRLELHDVAYDHPEKEPTVTEQKEALMTNKFLSHRLRGTLRLFDEKTGELLDEQHTTLMRVPYLSDRHTFIHNGSEYATLNQARLMPGAYTRRKESGEIESHFNPRRGTGSAFRIELEPQTGLFRLTIGQSRLRLYSLLHDIGVPDEELEKAWGPELLNVNRTAYDKRVFDNAYSRLVRKPDPSATREQKVAAIHAALGEMRLSREVMRRTLPAALEKQAKQAAMTNIDAAPQTTESADAALDQDTPQVAPQVTPQVAEEAPVGPEQGLTALDPAAATTPFGEDDAAVHLSREDLLGIAMLLNESYDAGIPLEETVGELSADIKEVVNQHLPGLHPELVDEFASPAVKEALTRGELDALAHEAATSPHNDLPLPSKAQRDAGNYRKGHVWLRGLNISIENPRDSVRSGRARNGKKWRTVMKHHYGYIRGTEACDGDQVDVFIGPDLDSDKVFIVNQHNPHDGSFDEFKCMLCFPDEESARKGYLANYQKNWKGLGSIAQCTWQEFKDNLHLFRKAKPVLSTIKSAGRLKWASPLTMAAPPAMHAPAQPGQAGQAGQPDPLQGYMDFTRPFEGVRTQVYRDPENHPTIGIGMNLDNTGSDARLRQVGADPRAIRAGKAQLNLNQVNQLYRQDMQSALTRAQKVVPSFAQQPQMAQRSLVDLSFNLGNKLTGFPKFLGALGKNDYGTAANELQNSKWFGQVGKRGPANVDIFRGLAAQPKTPTAGGGPLTAKPINPGMAQLGKPMAPPPKPRTLMPKPMAGAGKIKPLATKPTLPKV